MEEKKEFVKIRDVCFANGIMVIEWIAEIGFGELTIYANGEHQFDIDTEACGEEFCKRVLDATTDFFMLNANID